MFKLAQSAQKRGRRLNGHALIIPLLEGKTFQDELLQDAAATVRESLQAVIDHIHKELTRIGRELLALVESDDDWRERAALLQSVPGVGAISTQTLLAELPELGRLGRGQIAPLAPMNRGSGPFRGQRTIGGGRAAVRSVRSMAARSAQKFHPVIRRFAGRLAQGTPP
ncbi:MAG: transposase [Planctomycetaceae bacterium]